MTYFSIENFLQNSCFAILLFTTLIYWSQAAFSSVINNFNSFGYGGIVLSNLALITLLTLRWIESKHFPLSNLYESLIFLTWGLTLFHLILEKFTKNNYIGLITTPVTLFIIAFASFSLPTDMQKATPLVPALQSNWLMMHVTIMILSYAALMSGCLLAVGFLVLFYSNKFILDEKTTFHLNYKNQNSSSKNELPGTELREQSSMNTVHASKHHERSSSESSALSVWQQAHASEKQSALANSSYGEIEILSIANNLDNLSYRALGLGFPLLTIGILSGAVWANETWGSYWSWDPKETWALITWVVFAIYLHTRIIKGWNGEKPAIIASFGFLIVWVCFLGVNLFGKGLHSYGWISGN